MEKRYRVNELSRLGNRNDCPLYVIELWKIKMLNLAITFDEKNRRGENFYTAKELSGPGTIRCLKIIEQDGCQQI